MASSIIHAALQKNMNLEIIIIIEKLYYSNKQCSILYIQFDRKWHANGQFMSFQGLKSCFVFWCEQYTQTLIQRTRASDSFCSLYQIIHYIQAPGTRGGPGGPGPPRIEILYSKNFQSRQNFIFRISPPLDKNRSQAPGHG